MKFVNLGYAFLFVSFASGCGVTDKTGLFPLRSCDSEFVGDYNMVVHSQNQVAQSSGESRIAAAHVMHGACAKLYDRHNEVSCKALVDGKEKKVDSNDFRIVCNEVAAAIAHDKPQFTPMNPFDAAVSDDQP